jgi:hypothetical protein
MLGFRHVMVGLVMLTGCASAEAEKAPKIGSGQRTQQAIVGGSTSTTAQDAAVMVGLGPNQGACTGVLIAPNLVLTARHCVAQPTDATNECSPFTATLDPSTFSIHLGANALPGALPAAVVKKITVSNTSNMCSYDVALLELDKKLTSKVATLRFTELTANEALTALATELADKTKLAPHACNAQRTCLASAQRRFNSRPN